MSNIPAIDAVYNGRIETAPEWIRPTGNNGMDIEQNFNRVDSKNSASRAMNAKTQVKRKDKGLLEIVCKSIVDHQIGISALYYSIGETL
jgi:hypothetical protein